MSFKLVVKGVTSLWWQPGRTELCGTLVNFLTPGKFKIPLKTTLFKKWNFLFRKWLKLQGDQPYSWKKWSNFLNLKHEIKSMLGHTVGKQEEWLVSALIRAFKQGKNEHAVEL